MPNEIRVGTAGTVSSYTLHYAQVLTEMQGATLAGTAHLDRSPRYIKASWNLSWLTRYRQTLEAYAETFKAPLYERPEEMITAEKLAAVCITTEDCLHLHHAVRAIVQGVHVLCPSPSPPAMRMPNACSTLPVRLASFCCVASPSLQPPVPGSTSDH